MALFSILNLGVNYVDFFRDKYECYMVADSVVGLLDFKTYFNIFKGDAL